MPCYSRGMISDSTIPDADKRKLAYAALLLKARTPDEQFAAAREIEPNEIGIALWIAHHWPHDEAVKAEMARLKKTGADGDDLPTAADLARTVWSLTQVGLFDDRIKAAKLYAEIRGLIKKPEAAVNVNVNNNRVMVIREKGTDAEWEDGVGKQQAALIQAANATKH